MQHNEWPEVAIVGPAADEGAVDVEILKTGLTNLGEMALLLGAMRDGYEIRQHFRPPAATRQRYALQVGLPRAGSYALPFRVADTSPQPPLFDADEPVDVALQVAEVLALAASGDAAALAKAVPDPTYRRRLVAQALEMAPPVGERWGVAVRANGRSVTLDEPARRRLEAVVAPAVAPSSTMTVTGELTAVDFDQTQIRLRYAPTSREIVCSYLLEIEDQILASRRDLVEVTGQFTLDDAGQPTKLVQVSRVAPVDLSPIVLTEIEHDGTTLVADPPLRLEVTLDETQQLYEVTDTSLSLILGEETREELLAELEEAVVFCWRFYGQRENPDELTPQAQAVGATYRRRFREVQHAL
ncbi:MAG TPA: hypothetical protein DCZ72_14070 [Armatimonadetes bacterium]|nr:hypothetical protein [Armatimonadota bacterium]